MTEGKTSTDGVGVTETQEINRSPNPQNLRCPCGANLGDCSHAPRFEDCTPIEDFMEMGIVPDDGHYGTEEEQ